MTQVKHFIITDWAGNVLQHDGRFNLPQFAVPMTFESFDDAWDWIMININEDQHSDVFAVEKLNNVE